MNRNKSVVSWFKFAGGEEMGERVRAFDWASSSLGPVEGWPSALVSTLSICLSARFPMAIYWGAQGFLLYNDAWRPIVGDKHPWALGRPAHEVWPEIWETINPLFESVRTTGRATWRGDELLPMQRFGYTEECYFDYTFNPIFGPSGEIEGILNIVQETTFRVLNDRRTRLLRDLASCSAAARTEKEACDLAISAIATDPADIPFALLYVIEPAGRSARLIAGAGLAENSPARLTVVDVTGETADCCWPFTIAHRSSKPLLVDDLAERFGTFPRGHWPEPTVRALVLPVAASGPEGVEAMLVAGVSPRRKLEVEDEYYRFFELVASHVASTLASAKAYEEERKRAEVLVEIDRAKTTFFSNVSHELRTPLTLILGSIEEMLSEPETSWAARERLDVAHRNSLRLLNLLSNAFKYTLEGEIVVTLRQLDRQAELSVRDSGIGIPERELPRLFQRFHRIEASQGRTHEGTGIGLALVQELVKLHGGTVRVSSVYGKGSTFTVSLPLGRLHLPADRVKTKRTLPSTAFTSNAYTEEALRWLPGAATTGNAPEFDETPAATNQVDQFFLVRGARIILADDNADMRDYVRRLLIPFWNVEAVADGQAALEAARRERPDLVLADVMMPRLDGFGLLRALRADEALKSVPVIFLSARAGEESRVEGMEAGADDYLVKPFSKRELLARVGAHLELARVRREAAEEIRRREAQFSALIHQAPIGIVLLDADLRFQLVNPTALPVFEVADLVGRHFSQVMHMMWAPEVARQLVERFRQTLDTGEPYIVPEFVHERRDRPGREYFQCETYRLAFPDGKMGLVSYFADISTHVLGRQALLESEGKFRQLANTIPQLVWVAKPDGSITWYNERWYEYTGTNYQDMEGWGWQSVHDPNLLPKVLERWRRSIETGDSFDMTFPIKGADGVFRPFLTRVNPLRDADGQIVLWFGTNTDVSERAKLEERFRITADSAPVLIWMSDTTKARTWFNKPWLDFRGRTMEEECGDGWTEGVHPEDLDRCVHIYSSHFDARIPYKMEYRLRRHDGEWRWIIAHGIPLYEGRGGEFSGFIGSLIDITDMKQAEKERLQLLDSERAARTEAERASRLKDDFLTTLSHELRTPLNAILGWSQLLEWSNLTSEELREGLSVISRNARAQTQLIEDLLDMSRIMSGKLALNLQQVNPKEVVEQALESVLPAAQVKRICIEKILDANTGSVTGDPSRLQQITWNLLNNAVKFTPKDGKVRVLLERADSDVRICVSDTGQGINPEFLPFVFERFRQADATTTRRQGGLGIGLSIVKQLTEMHGGTVAAQSQGEGKGAEFTVRLPLSIANVSQEIASDHAAEIRTHVSEQIGLEGVKVLVVDNDPDTQTVTRRILMDCKARVSTANSAVEGHKLFLREIPDVIVSDISMPDVDGYEFIRWIRRLPAAEGGQTPAAALTAFARPEDRRNVLLAGFQAHLVKPVEPAELVRVIDSLARRSRAH